MSNLQTFIDLADSQTMLLMHTRTLPSFKDLDDDKRASLAMDIFQLAHTEVTTREHLQEDLEEFLADHHVKLTLAQGQNLEPGFSMHDTPHECLFRSGDARLILYWPEVQRRWQMLVKLGIQNFSLQDFAKTLIAYNCWFIYRRAESQDSWTSNGRADFAGSFEHDLCILEAEAFADAYTENPFGMSFLNDLIQIAEGKLNLQSYYDNLKNSHEVIEHLR